MTQDTATVDKLSGTGLIAQGRMTPVAPDAPAPAAQQGGQAAPQNATQVNIMADPRVNAVLVNDAEYRMPYYAKVIADLDRPVELVEIHAAIVDIDSDFKRDLGVTYQGANSRDKGWSTGGEFSGTGDKFSPLPTMGTPSGTGMNLSTIYTHGADFFLARIQALEAEGEARMLGRPSVLTVDNVQATLENTSTYYIQVEGYQAVDLFKVEAGTVLRVTTSSATNAAKPPSSSRSACGTTRTTADAPVSDNSVPPIKQTKINTQAIVGAGQSLLIGGYYYEQKSTDASGIPILMHIPVLGNLFKTTSKGTKRMERLILITPKVIHLDEIPTTPPRVDEPTFHRSPTQADYEERVPAAPQSGCSRKRPELETVAPATAIPLSPPAARQSPGVQAQARPAGAL
ncbi:MAG: type III secretion system outer membrane ring subunit SctC [Bilophila wadsworthia]